MDNVEPTDFQAAVLRFRDHANIMSAGGRGSGKTFGMCLHVVDHCRFFGPDAAPLVTRESWSGLQQIMDTIMDLARGAFGDVARNKVAGTLTLPGGAVITFTNISDEKSMAKMIGKTFTGLFSDEVGNYPPQAWKFLRKIRSTLRVPVGRRVSIHMTANPHGRSHTVVMKGFVSKAPPWHIFQDEGGDPWIWTSSTYKDNDRIDREAYRRQLISSCGADTALADAWLTGSWSVLGGVMFDMYDPAVHLIQKPVNASWKFRCGGDWGSNAPAVVILMGQLKADNGPLRYGSIVCLEEIDTALPNDLSLGNGAPPQVLAEMTKEMCARHGWRRPHVIMDDARGLASETVVNLFIENGIGAHKPQRKDRVGQWTLIRSLLANAVTGDGPGLYFTAACPHLLETLPEAPRGTLRAEDIDPKWDRDHWCDAMAYSLVDLWGRRATSGHYTTN